VKTFFKKSRNPVQRNITIVFIGVLITAVLFGALISSNNINARRTEALVNHTFRVSHQAELIRSTIAENEAKLDRYILTRDRQWLNSFELTRAELAKACKETRDIVVDSSQQTRLDSIQTLLTRKADTQSAIIRNLPEATGIPSFGSEDRNVTIALEALLDRFMLRQDQLLEIRSQKSDQARLRYSISIITAALLLFTFITGALLRLNRDIHRRKLIEDELKINELKYRRLVDDASVTLFTSDTNGLFTFVNEKCQQLTGFSQEELIGKSFTTLLLPSWIGQIGAVYLQQARDRTPELTIEFPIVTREGDIKWVEQHSVILYDEHQRPHGYQCVVKDISERREQQEKLKASETRFRAALGSLGDNVWEYDLVSNNLVFTEARNTMLAQLNETTGNHYQVWINCLHPDDQWMLREMNEQYREAVIDRHSLEYRVICSDNSVKWVLDRGFALEKAHDGTPVRILGTHTDITESKNALVKLRESDLKIRAMLKSTHDGFFMIDKEKKIIQLNEAANQFLTLLTGRDGQPGDLISDYVNTDRKEIFENIFQSVFAGNSEAAELKFDCRNGEKWFDVDYFPVFDDEREVVAMCIASRDITERKLTENALDKIRAEREEYQFRLQSIIDNTPLIIFVKDLEGRYLLVNRSFRQTFDLEEKDVIGNHDLDFNTPEQTQRYIKADQEVITTLRSIEIEETLQTPEGIRNLQIVKFPLFDKNKNIYGIGGIARDYTNEVNYRQKLIEAREKAEANGKGNDLVDIKETVLLRPNGRRK
jgi:PAS domain S-box-containing protein